MRLAGRAALLLSLALGLASCARVEPVRPDVVLITVDRFAWHELAHHGGTIAAPALAALEEQSARFDAAVSMAPGGAPAAVSVLTGVAPSMHGVRALAGDALSPGVATLAERFVALGYRTGAILETDELQPAMRADRGFEAWDAPASSFPTAHPFTGQRRGAEDAAATGIHWLRQRKPPEPAFLWLHLAEPAPSFMSPEERAGQIGGLDRILGKVRASISERGEVRGAPPILVLCNLSSHGADAARAGAEGFLLDAVSLRVRVLASAPGLPAGTHAELIGLDEVSDFILALATGGESRLLDIARDNGKDERAVVLAETLVPLTSMGASPVMAVVRTDGPSAVGNDPAILAAQASDTSWPGGLSRVAAESMLPAYLELDRAMGEIARGRFDEATARVAPLIPVEGAAAPGARVALGLAHLGAARFDEARVQFERLEADSSPPGLNWQQGVLGQSLVARRAGDFSAARAAADRLLQALPRDLRALSWLGETAEAAGDRQAAVQALLTTLEVEPRHPFANASVARLMMGIGRPREAAMHFDRALERRPSDAALLLESATAYLAAGDGWTALDRLEERVRIHGESPQANLAIGTVWHTNERWELAGEYYSRVIDKHPDNAEATVRLADVRLREGNEAEGRELLVAAESLVPGSHVPCSVIAQWLTDTGRTGEAAAEQAACLQRVGARALAPATAGGG